jgi:hypothetical protein
MKLIFTKYSLARFPGDNLIVHPHLLMYSFDVDDSALDDPTIAEMVAENSYLPADRKALKSTDLGILGVDLVLSCQRVSAPNIIFFTRGPGSLALNYS